MRKLIVLDVPAIIEFVRIRCPEFVGARVVHPDHVEYRDVDGADVIGDLSFEDAARCGRYRRVEFQIAPRPEDPDATLEDVRAAGPLIRDYSVFRDNRVELTRFLRTRA